MLQIPALAALWLCALTLAAPSAGSKRWPKAAILAGAAFALVSWIPKTLAASSPARAAAVFPADPGPREDLAYAAMAAGKAGDADTHWAAAQRLAPFNAIYPWRRAQIAGAMGFWARAAHLSSQATGLEPGFLNARLLRAEALVRLGRKPEARAELDELLKARALRGDILSSSGYERAVWTLDRRDFDRVAVLAGRPPLGR